MNMLYTFGEKLLTCQYQHGTGLLDIRVTYGRLIENILYAWTFNNLIFCFYVQNTIFDPLYGTVFSVNYLRNHCLNNLHLYRKTLSLHVVWGRKVYHLHKRPLIAYFALKTGFTDKAFVMKPEICHSTRLCTIFWLVRPNKSGI